MLLFNWLSSVKTSLSRYDHVRRSKRRRITHRNWPIEALESRILLAAFGGEWPAVTNAVAVRPRDPVSWKQSRFQPWREPPPYFILEPLRKYPRRENPPPREISE